MPNYSSKVIPLRYLLIVFLILALSVFAFFQYAGNVNSTRLKANLADMVRLKEDYSRIDSCIYTLYKAENSSRLYAVTADKAYIRKFSAEIRRVSASLSDLKNTTGNRKAESNFKNLISQKKKQTENYLKLRKLTDSLAEGFLELELMERKVPKIALLAFKAPVKPTVQIDTIKQQSTAPKKRLFGRIADAFSSKPKTAGQVTITKTEIRKEQLDDIANQIKKYNDRQLGEIRNYYKNLYSNSNKLKEEERSILLLNNRLIGQIVVLLNQYKRDEKKFISESKALLSGELQSQIKEVDRISIINSAILLSLILALCYNIVKLFKYERLLVSVNKRARQDAHSKSLFLANMSHEIRTPLNSIIGFSEQLEHSQLNDQQEDQVKAVRNSSELLLEVVNEILDFSKFEVGKISFEHKPFTPKDEIMEIFNSMDVLATNKNISLINKVNLDRDIAIVGDRFRLKQVIMNLLSNAIKFTTEGEVILKAQFIVGSGNKGILKVQVEDTGIGINTEEMQIIFDEFSQIYSSSKSRQQGTGLGLAISKKIIELQGGKIKVSSTIGKGSLFSFEIPYEMTEKAREVKAETSVSANGELAGKRILLVDDNKMNVLLAQTILKKWGIVYDSAYDGKEALELFRRNAYDLVLTDIQMPVMGGVELTHEIRYNGEVSKSNIPVLGVTAHVLLEDRDVYLKAGMNNLVLKPFSEKELVDQIIKYI
jgi:signal transduction histidine kinase